MVWDLEETERWDSGFTGRLVDGHRSVSFPGSLSLGDDITKWLVQSEQPRRVILALNAIFYLIGTRLSKGPGKGGGGGIHMGEYAGT